MTSKSRLSGILVLFVAMALTACGGGGDDAPPPASSSASAVVGPAGGTVNGPDGVQVVVPAGALSTNTTIGIARGSAGAPAVLQEGNAPAGPIYEFTPHGVVFNTPVTIRIPVPANAASTEVFMASLGEDWQVNDATAVGGYAQWQRNSFSFGMLGEACAIPIGNTDPYPCVYPKGYARASATPASAITQVALGSWNNTAGSWTVNGPGTVNLTLHYEAAPDCGNARVNLIRWNPAVNPRVTQTLLNNVAVGLTSQPITPPIGAMSDGGTPPNRGKGDTIHNISAYLTDPVNVFYFSFSCQRPNRPVIRGGDLVTIIGPMAAPSGPYTIGGTINGLTGAGLVLRNNGGDDLAVPANATNFTFNTAIAAGAPYNVSVQTQPAGQTCTVQNATATGTANANVTSVAITCGSAGQLAIVANGGVTNGVNAVSVYRVNPSTGELSFLNNANAGNSPYAVVLSPNGLNAYVSNQMGDSVSAYSIDNVNGVLTPIGARVSNNASGLAMDRLGRYIWVANYGWNTVQTLTIGAGGALVSALTPISTGFTLPYAIAAHPTIDYVYVAHDSGTGAITVHSVNPDGSLTLQQDLSNAIFGPTGLVIDPSGRFAYASARTGGVCAYRINALDGRLTSAGCANLSSGGSTYAVAVHPNGLYAYAASNLAANNVVVFAINQTSGVLTQVGSPVSAGNNARGLAVSPAGNYLYVTNYVDNSVSAFSISSGGSVLSSLGAATPTGISPQGIAVTPPGTVTIGGTVSGLTGAGLVLQNNGGDDEAVAANAASFTFNTALAEGATYSVSVQTQPAGQSCTIQNATGNATANVTNVQVNCNDNGAIAQIVSGSTSSCARYTDGRVKCWGTNDWAELGLGVLGGVRGDSAAEMGSALPFVNLGTGRTAVQISSGSFHVCAVLDNGSLKCWGNNGVGMLGLGLSPVLGSPAFYIGDDLSEMGDGLPAINLGTGRTVVEVAAGFNHTCALLDNATVKCWGINTLGQTGLGNASMFGAGYSIGDDPAEMGDGLPAVQLGTGRSAVAIRAGYQSTCALLDNQTFKCWGTNDYGQLGLGVVDTDTRGDVPGEMGDNLPAVNVGTGRTVVEFSLGFGHTCVRLDNGSIKCWGQNASGQLGLGDVNNRGDTPGEMGDNLPAVSLGAGRTAVGLANGGNVTCARLDNVGLKCWGYNAEGQLGLGDVNHRGDAPGEMGDSLPFVQLGAGRTAVEIAADSGATCAILDNGTVKCWGFNDVGQLGLGDLNHRGDNAGEMGDNLPPVDLTP
jgi:6-phosphogluconolactonase (cycloisomerase 2 family)/alpha-tubulin suppressor-like RCC1 family protein